MRLRLVLKNCLAFGVCSALPSLVQAAAQATVTVGPFTGEPVPTLSGNLQIALGLLLAVIAFRMLKNQRGAQKLFSLLVLGGGLVISGIGVDRTLAVVDPNLVPAAGAVCTQAGPLPYNPFEDSTLENQCANAIEIKSIIAPECADFDTESANCKVGQVLTATGPGSSCAYLPKCNDS